MLPKLVTDTAAYHERTARPFTLSAEHRAHIATLGPRDRRLTLGDLFHVHCYHEIERLPTFKPDLLLASAVDTFVPVEPFAWTPGCDVVGAAVPGLVEGR